MSPSEILRKLADLLDDQSRKSEIDVTPDNKVDSVELKQDPIMVPPLQQDIELKKAALGKDSEVTDELTADDPTIGSSDCGCDDDKADGELNDILKNAGISNVLMDIINGPLDV